jgi:hypothetical protein
MALFLLHFCYKYNHMEPAVIVYTEKNYLEEIASLAAEQSLVYYASEAADQMGFDTLNELQDAVQRAMDLCQATGLPVRTNFRRIFKASPVGLMYDWKLSTLAYYLVQLNGDSSNPRVARLQMELLKTAFA